MPALPRHCTSRPPWVPVGPRAFQVGVPLGSQDVFSFDCPHQADLGRRLSRAAAQPPCNNYLWGEGQPCADTEERKPTWICYTESAEDDDRPLCLDMLYDLWFTRCGGHWDVLLPGDSHLTCPQDACRATFAINDAKYWFTEDGDPPSLPLGEDSVLYLLGAARCIVSDDRRSVSVRDAPICFSLRCHQGIFYLCTGASVRLVPMVHAHWFLNDLYTWCISCAHPAPWHQWRVGWSQPSNIDEWKAVPF